MDKKCSLCGRWKPVEDFHRDKTKADGRVTYCKECVQKYGRERRRRLTMRGICVVCGKRPAETGRACCQVCGDRNRERQRDKRREAKGEEKA